MCADNTLTWDERFINEDNKQNKTKKEKKAIVVR